MMMLTIAISTDDVEALARTATSEVGHFGKFGEATLKGAAEAVVDTILNRVAHPSFQETIEEVVNAYRQFSAIGGPGGVGTWRRLPKASASVVDIVQVHLQDRLRGKACTVKGATHFLNPYYSSRHALRTWGDYVVRHAVAKWGRGRNVHFHGSARGTGAPQAYRLELNGQWHDFTGKGMSLPTGSIAQVAADLPMVDHEEPNAAVSSSGQGDDKEGGFSLLEEDQEDETRAYRVEEVPVADAASVQAVLNQLSAEGWHARQIVPLQDKLLLVFEGHDARRFVHEFDDRIDVEESALAAPPVVIDTSPEGHFAKFLGDLRLAYFAPHEFLVLGGQHLAGLAKGKNTLPPEELWPNIRMTAGVLDVLRARLGDKIHLSSIYRSPAYNALLPGAAVSSMHMQFCAADFVCADGRGSVWWAKQLKRLRDEDAFMGGIGVYPTFVHLDTRGYNVEFGSWERRVFR